MLKTIQGPVKQQEWLQSRILMIDDTPVNIEIQEEILSQAGFKHLTGFTNSSDAVHELSRMDPNSIDLVLLDLMMPDMDGFVVLERLRSMQVDVPILIITARNDFASRIKALGLGAQDFIIRPFENQEFLLRIEVHLRASLNAKRLQKRNLHLDELVKERTAALEKINAELNENYLDTLQRMAYMAELRDPETGNHMTRIGHFSYLLAKSCGLSELEANDYLHAAPLHDAGKVETPDHILLKPGKLLEEEWGRMKQHAQFGFEMLKGHQSKIMNKAALIALSHHEKWDGSGYPQGLEGENIPLCGRIVAITDVYDALTSKRPYKEPWPQEKAIRLLESEKGHHFEPKIADKFIEILPQISAIQQKFAD